MVDFQRAFTDASFSTGGAPLVRRAVDNTARLLQVARRAGVPVASCFMCYHSERDAPHWKVGGISELVSAFREHPQCRSAFQEFDLHDPVSRAQQYIETLSATGGMPHVMVKRNMQKIHHALTKMKTVLNGLTRGLDQLLTR